MNTADQDAALTTPAVSGWRIFPIASMQRWRGVLVANHILFISRIEGQPFEDQWELWLEQLDRQRGLAPWRGQPCSHHLPAAGTLIWNSGICPQCGRLLGPEAIAPVARGALGGAALDGPMALPPNGLPAGRAKDRSRVATRSRDFQPIR
jgi:hypothetical protein